MLLKNSQQSTAGDVQVINIVMLVKDRPRLTLQALTSLVKNTDVDYNVTIIDDGSAYETRDMLGLFGKLGSVAVLRNETSKGITGQVRNLGVYWAERYWGRGDYLYLSDNDVYFRPNWASKMIAVYDGQLNAGLEVLGGVRHPYHQPLHLHEGGWAETDAVAGYSQLMNWAVWVDNGPLDAHAPGVCQSEDHQFCQRILTGGGKVGYMIDPVIIDCGLTNTDGKPATGYEVKQVGEAGVYYE